MLVGVAFLPLSFPPSEIQAFYIISRPNCLKICNTVYIATVYAQYASNSCIYTEVEKILIMMTALAFYIINRPNCLNICNTVYVWQTANWAYDQSIQYVMPTVCCYTGFLTLDTVSSSYMPKPDYQKSDNRLFEGRFMRQTLMATRLLKFLKSQKKHFSVLKCPQKTTIFFPDFFPKGLKWVNSQKKYTDQGLINIIKHLFFHLTKFRPLQARNQEKISEVTTVSFRDVLTFIRISHFCITQRVDINSDGNVNFCLFSISTLSYTFTSFFSFSILSWPQFFSMRNPPKTIKMHLRRDFNLLYVMLPNIRIPIPFLDCEKIFYFIRKSLSKSATTI